MKIIILFVFSLILVSNAFLLGKKKTTTTTEEAPSLSDFLAKFTVNSKSSETTTSTTTSTTTTTPTTQSTTSKEKSKFKEFFGFGKEKSTTTTSPTTRTTTTIKSTTSKEKSGIKEFFGFGKDKSSTTTTKSSSTVSVAHGVHDLINSLIKGSTKSSLISSNSTHKTNSSFSLNDLVKGLNRTNSTGKPSNYPGTNLTVAFNRNSTKQIPFVNGTTNNQTLGLNGLIFGLINKNKTNLTTPQSPSSGAGGLQDLLAHLNKNSSTTKSMIKTIPSKPFSHNQTTTNRPPFQLDGPCLPNPCKNSGKCIADRFSSLGFRCECTTLFTGDTCEVLNHCFSNPCKNGGICHNLRLSFWCTCPKGFTGSQCEKHSDYHTFKPEPTPTKNQKYECLNNVCLNGGTCFNFTMGIHCQCPASHKGIRCEQAFLTPSSVTTKKGSVVTKLPVKNACLPNPCKNGGSCEPFADGLIHYCYCRSPFYGENCEKSKIIRFIFKS